MIVFWCFILIILGAVGLINDIAINFLGSFEYMLYIAIMFVSLGLLFNSYRKAKSGRIEQLENRIKELEAQLTGRDLETE